MLLRFYRNTLAAIRQWLENIHFAISPVPVRIRIDKSEQVQRPGLQRLNARQQRMIYSKYRR